MTASMYVSVHGGIHYYTSVGLVVGSVAQPLSNVVREIGY